MLLVALATSSSALVTSITSSVYLVAISNAGAPEATDSALVSSVTRSTEFRSGGVASKPPE